MPSYFGIYFDGYFGYFPSTDNVPDENTGSTTGSSVPVSRPFRSGGETPVDENCIEFDILEIPAPTEIDINCEAGVVQPPPPPPFVDFVGFTIKEAGPIKQLMPYPYRFSLSGSENWILGFGGFPADLPVGEKILMTSNPFLAIPGAGVNASNWVVDHDQGGVRGWLDILLGNRNGSKNLAPKYDLAHLPPNSAYLRIPGVWHGPAAPITINSWNPFSAEVCLTNTISGFPETTQYAPIFSPAWSPDYGIYHGSTIKLVMEPLPH